MKTDKKLNLIISVVIILIFCVGIIPLLAEEISLPPKKQLSSRDNAAPIFDPISYHVVPHGAVSYGIVIGATDSGGDTMTLSVNGIPVSEDSLEITHNEPGRIEAVLWVNTWVPLRIPMISAIM